MSKKAEERTSSYAEDMGLEPVPLSVAAMVVMLCILDRHVPMMISESGIGKTAVLRRVGELQNMETLLYTLAHSEPSDLKGPMWPTGNGTFTTLPDGRIPFIGLENVLERVLVFFDEANRAEQTTLNAMMGALMERRLGGHSFGPNVAMAIAINPPDGEYAVTSSFTSDPAMRRRVCQIPVLFSQAEFFRYAENPGAAMQNMDFEPFEWSEEAFQKRKLRPFHHVVLSYLRANPGRTLDRDARDAGKVYGCPATWEQVSDTLYTVESLKLDLSSPFMQRVVQTKLAGHVGVGTARDVLRHYAQESASIEPGKVLEEYEEGTSTYQRVQQLIQNNDNAQLADLMTGLALTFFGQDKWYAKLEEIVPRMAQLYYDLPPTQSTRLTGQLAEQGRAWHPDNQYPEELNQFYVKLALHPTYRAYKERRSEAYEQKDDERKEALDEAKKQQKT